jgi:hypothetical protein
LGPRALQRRDKAIAATWANRVSESPVGARVLAPLGEFHEKLEFSVISVDVTVFTAT